MGAAAPSSNGIFSDIFTVTRKSHRILVACVPPAESVLTRSPGLNDCAARLPARRTTPLQERDVAKLGRKWRLTRLRKLLSGLKHQAEHAGTWKQYRRSDLVTTKSGLVIETYEITPDTLIFVHSRTQCTNEAFRRKLLIDQFTLHTRVGAELFSMIPGI